MQSSTLKLLLDPSPSFVSAAFQTYIGGAPRTCGVIGTSLSPGTALTAAQLQSLAPYADYNPMATARGKVVALQAEAVAVFQTGAGAHLEPVWCGHGTAPAAMVLAGTSACTFTAIGPDNSTCAVDACVRDDVIEQIWTVPAPSITASVWKGRPVLHLSALNPYAVLLGPLPAGTAIEQARHELAGAALGAKLVVVTPGSIPFLQFANSNGIHGAAPLTGLATIALALGCGTWLDDVIDQHVVGYNTPDGIVIESLPITSPAGKGSMVVEMPAVRVVLTAVTFEKGRTA